MHTSTCISKRSEAAHSIAVALTRDVIAILWEIKPIVTFPTKLPWLISRTMFRAFDKIVKQVARNFARVTVPSYCNYFSSIHLDLWLDIKLIPILIKTYICFTATRKSENPWTIIKSPSTWVWSRESKYRGQCSSWDQKQQVCTSLYTKQGHSHHVKWGPVGKGAMYQYFR